MKKFLLSLLMLFVCSVNVQAQQFNNREIVYKGLTINASFLTDKDGDAELSQVSIVMTLYNPNPQKVVLRDTPCDFHDDALEPGETPIVFKHTIPVITLKPGMNRIQEVVNLGPAFQQITKVVCSPSKKAS